MEKKIVEAIDVVRPEIFNFSEALDYICISLEGITERTSNREKNGISAIVYIMNEHYKAICEKMDEIDLMCMEYGKENISHKD